MAEQLTTKDLQELRSRGLLKETEIAFKEGNFVIAEDLLSKSRRIVNTSGIMLESSRRLLND